MTFVTVIKSVTFPLNTIEVDLTGLFTGNLTGNVLDCHVITFDSLRGIQIGDQTTTATNAYSIVIGKASSVTHANAIVIGTNASSTAADDIVLGQQTPTGTPTATAWGQTFCDRGWVGGGVTGVLIDNSGNLIRGNTGNGGGIGNITANLDMNCYYISNVMGLQVDTVTSKGLDVGTLANVVSFDSPPVINVTTTGGGIQNQFWGYQNGIAITTGTRNTSQGYRALASVTIGSRNVSVGDESMENVVGVNDCIAIGHRAAEAISTTSIGSVVIGSYAARQVGTSSGRIYGSVVIGFRSLESCTGLSNCSTFIGSKSGLEVTASGFANTAIGYQAMQYGPKSPVAELGEYNVAVGYKAMTYGTTGQGCIAVGHLSLRGNFFWNRTAGWQIGIGLQAGAYVNSDYAIAIGQAAMRGAVSTQTTGFTSHKSIAIGYWAMYNARSGSDYSIAIGGNALIDCRGNDNIGIGHDVGGSITIGYNNILIGRTADVFLGFNSGAISLGYNCRASSYAVTLGYNSYGSDYDAIVIGRGASSSGEDTITFGRPSPSNATATATAWGQIFCNRAWVGGGVTSASIDNGGNIIPGNTGGGTLDVANGGTGATTFGTGSILLGNGTSALNELADVSVGSSLTSGGVGLNPGWTQFTSSSSPSTIMSRDSLGNTSANNFISGYATTATAGGTTTLNSASAQYQYFTGTSTQTVVLPVVSTLVTGFWFKIVNNSTGMVTIQSSGLNNIITLSTNQAVQFICILITGTDASSWSYQILGRRLDPTPSAITSTISMTNVLTLATSTFAIPANYIVAGHAFQIECTGLATTNTGGAACLFQVRIGSTNSSSDTLVASDGLGAAVGAGYFKYICTITWRSTTSVITVFEWWGTGQGLTSAISWINGGSVTAVSNTSTTYITLFARSGAANNTIAFYQSLISKI